MCNYSKSGTEAEISCASPSTTNMSNVRSTCVKSTVWPSDINAVLQQTPPPSSGPAQPAPAPSMQPLHPHLQPNFPHQPYGFSSSKAYPHNPYSPYSPAHSAACALTRLTNQSKMDIIIVLSHPLQVIPLLLQHTTT